MTSNRKRELPRSGLAVACLLGLAFLGLSYLRLWGDTGSAEFGGKIIEAALAKPVLGTALGHNLMLFAAAQVSLHLGLGLVCFCLAYLSRLSWQNKEYSQRIWVLLWFIAATTWLLIANATWFPASSLGTPYASVAAMQWKGINLLSIASTALAVGAVTTVVRALGHLRRDRPKTLVRWAVPALATLLVITLIGGQAPAVASRSTPSQPNVIIIGLDSLRFDAVRQSDSTNTPVIDEFLAGATTFSDATTPLARTFPSWVSIISGRHPHTTGAVMNLLPRHMIDTGETLPDMMGRAGYKSVYAIDEVRFSNLDKSYGFDEMLAPPIGATDFLLGFFTDSPLSNVVVNSWLGTLLFPYAHANRAAALTYDPDAFVRRVDRHLRIEGPTFLAVHLTLAHWPYTWAGTELPPDGAPPELKPLYYRAVSRLDQQFSDLMSVLKKRGALENAIVIMLSDHGEALGNGELPHAEGSSMPDPRFDDSRILGHGTSVFSRHQYRVVLAVRSFGKTALGLTNGRMIDAPVSLEDITPTIADALSLNPKSAFDGISFLPLLRDDAPAGTSASDRIRFTETEFNPPGIVPGKFMSPSSLRDAASYYRVDPETDRVMLREEDIASILAKRQYAAFRDGRLLAAVPSADSTVPGLQLAFVKSDGEMPVWITEAALQSDRDASALWGALTTRFPALVDQVRFSALSAQPSP